MPMRPKGEENKHCEHRIVLNNFGKMKAIHFDVILNVKYKTW